MKSPNQILEFRPKMQVEVEMPITSDFEHEKSYYRIFQPVCVLPFQISLRNWSAQVMETYR